MLLLLSENVARAASPEGVIVIAVIYAILAVVGKLKKAANRGKEPPPPAEAKPVPRPSVQYPATRERITQPHRASPPLRRVPVPDTQSEAGKLEELLRGLGELAGLPDEGPLGRRSGTPLESAEEAENTESLEVDREVVSLEVDQQPNRRRVEVDQDEGAEALVQRRIQEAMARNRPLSQKDHQEFDKRLKTVAVKQSAGVAAATRQRMRNAIVWKEILGPPVALRDPLDFWAD